MVGVPGSGVGALGAGVGVPGTGGLEYLKGMLKYLVEAFQNLGNFPAVVDLVGQRMRLVMTSLVSDVIGE